MKYYLDVSAIVHLIERGKKNINTHKNVFVSRLVIEEMLKNLEKNYERQRAQFMFLKENNVKIDWRHYEMVVFLEPFGFDANYSLPYAKNSYDNILKYDNYSDFCSDGDKKNSMDSWIKGLVMDFQDNLIKHQLGFLTGQLVYRKNIFKDKKEYEIKK